MLKGHFFFNHRKMITSKSNGDVSQRCQKELI